MTGSVAVPRAETLPFGLRFPARPGRILLWTVLFLGGMAAYSLAKLNLPGAGEKVRYLYQTYRRIRSVVLAPDGSLWITTANNEFTRPRDPADDRVIRLLT